MNEIREYLISQGWKPSYDGYMGDEFVGYVDKDGDRFVDLTGDAGYVWELKKFTDSDIDGPYGLVAQGRFESADIEGDTLAELLEVLN
jgi:hypothetical protein